MIKKWITLLIINGFLIFYALGCATHTGKPEIQKPAPVPPHETGIDPAPEPVAKAPETAPEFSDEQLRGAKIDLEAFRLFCDHFKIQSDPNTLNSIKAPALEYIKNHIDPILESANQPQDDDYGRDILTIYYLKAYLYWIFDDSETARNLLAQIKPLMTPKLAVKTIYHFDQGEITIQDALLKLEKATVDQPITTQETKTE